MKTCDGCPPASADKGLYHDHSPNRFYFSQGNGTVRFVGMQRPLRSTEFSEMEIPAMGAQQYNSDFIRAEQRPDETFSDARRRLMDEHEELMNLSRLGALAEDPVKEARYNELTRKFLAGG